MRKSLKFKVGDKIYVKKNHGVAFGAIAFAESKRISSYRQSKISPGKLRLSTRTKVRYYVRFDESVFDGRLKNGRFMHQWVAESSIKLIPEDENELIRKLIGEDYL